MYKGCLAEGTFRPYVSTNSDKPMMCEVFINPSHDVVYILLLYTFLLLCFLQEWETKAGEAKRQYDKAKKEYKESGGGGGSTSSSKK